MRHALALLSLTLAGQISAADQSSIASPQSEGYWSKRYRIPESRELITLTLKAKDPAAAEAEAVMFLWKSGGKKVPLPQEWNGNYQYRSHSQPAQINWAQCTYRGVWSLPTAGAEAASKKLLDLGEPELFSRSSEQSDFEPAQVKAKIAGLKAERKRIVDSLAEIPGSAGLLDAELALLEQLSSRYRAFQNDHRLFLCIRPK